MAGVPTEEPCPCTLARCSRRCVDSCALAETVLADGFPMGASPGGLLVAQLYAHEAARDGEA